MTFPPHSLAGLLRPLEGGAMQAGSCCPAPPTMVRLFGSYCMHCVTLGVQLLSARSAWTLSPSHWTMSPCSVLRPCLVHSPGQRCTLILSPGLVADGNCQSC